MAVTVSSIAGIGIAQPITKSIRIWVQSDLRPAAGRVIDMIDPGGRIYITKFKDNPSCWGSKVRRTSEQLTRG